MTDDDLLAELKRCCDWEVERNNDEEVHYRLGYIAARLMSGCATTFPLVVIPTGLTPCPAITATHG